ncbi:LTA synthase family protein [Agathobaculum sp.]|uniref:LTA synthase family protein n=1 Tax=Agathobaculum sp. TaxID=2048138 RepID=UPI002A8094E6|nr:LTA synthase family protein [Agathobaculum sp.]MCI5704017.1 LTA synthase family protein [Pseudoflavonifractor sp.]MDY3618923.1 LTA synthase family protein [Agathobaculum sp.]
MDNQAKRLILRIGGAVGAFWAVDLLLRIFTGSASYYPLYAAAPNLFSIGFGALFTALCLLLPAKAGKAFYGVLYAAWAVYAVVQYGVHRIFERFLFLSDFLLAGEGLQFAGYIRQLVDGSFLLFVLLLMAAGALGVKCLPPRGKLPGCRAPLWLAAAFVLTQLIAPRCYAPVPDTPDWDSWQSSGYEYSRFTSSGYDMALTGPYQFVLRDAWLMRPGGGTQDEARAEADAFFAARPAHADNEMTGLLAGKNLIAVQLESIDDFVLNEENTPTLARMQREGINFSEFYTPQYANGYTFNTEFAAQTGVYPYANGNAAYSLSRSAFPYGFGHLFADGGYAANSFHKSEAKFYNRGAMHQAFGYAQYHSALDYTDDETEAGTDRFLAECDALYEKMTAKTPFLDFIITYSGHLGYDEIDALTTAALERYPEYTDPARPYEINGLFAKARLTDELFETLLSRLEADGLLENTAFLVYDDHYAYGLTDRAVLEEYSAAAGGRLLERTPCFLWYPGCAPQTVSKTLQTVDLLPTVANLFGLPAPQTPGQDAFDPAYPGYVIFADGSWMNGAAYVKNGAVQWNESMDDAEIAEMNAYARQFVRVCEAILDADYFRDD